MKTFQFPAIFKNIVRITQINDENQNQRTQPLRMKTLAVFDDNNQNQLNLIRRSNFSNKTMIGVKSQLKPLHDAHQKQSLKLKSLKSMEQDKQNQIQIDESFKKKSIIIRKKTYYPDKNKKKTILINSDTKRQNIVHYSDQNNSQIGKKKKQKIKDCIIQQEKNQQTQQIIPIIPSNKKTGKVRFNVSQKSYISILSSNISHSEYDNKQQRNQSKSQKSLRSFNKKSSNKIVTLQSFTKSKRRKLQNRTSIEEMPFFPKTSDKLINSRNITNSKRSKTKNISNKKFIENKNNQKQSQVAITSNILTSQRQKSSQQIQQQNIRPNNQPYINNTIKNGLALKRVKKRAYTQKFISFDDEDQNDDKNQNQNDLAIHSLRNFYEYEDQVKQNRVQDGQITEQIIKKTKIRRQKQNSQHATKSNKSNTKSNQNQRNSIFKSHFRKNRLVKTRTNKFSIMRMSSKDQIQRKGTIFSSNSLAYKNQHNIYALINEFYLNSKTFDQQQCNNKKAPHQKIYQSQRTFDRSQDQIKRLFMTKKQQKFIDLAKKVIREATSLGQKIIF